MIKCGLVGLPNVGKSTLFNALTHCEVPAKNYPFCTIEPNQGRVSVPDERLTRIAAIENSANVVPTTIDIVDIAGLVSGASLGKGMGNKFLRDVSNSNAIIHVVRCFEDQDIMHVAGTISPRDDICTIHTELLISDIHTLESILKSKKSALCSDLIKVCRNLLNYLEKNNLAINYLCKESDKKIINDLNLITSKPMLIAINTNFKIQDDRLVQQAKTYAQSNNLTYFEISIQDQYNLTRTTSELSPSLSEIIPLIYRTLNIQTYFTSGQQETRAWTIPCSSYAPIAGSVIHTDFLKKFIRCRVVGYQDFILSGGIKSAALLGKLRVEGKKYIVKEGDIIEFLINS